MIRVIHYVNQFFGQIGGEEKAGVPPAVVEGPVGPGLLIERILKDQGKVVATLLCGDNYFSEHVDAASEALLDMIKARGCDLFIAGPAFNAGRYGIACGEIVSRVSRELGLPAVTGMFPENPGVALYGKGIYMIETGANAAGMGKAMPAIIGLGLKLLRGETIGPPAEEGYIPRGIRANILAPKTGAERAIDLLLQKMKGLPFHTEISFSNLDTVAPAPPIPDLRDATIALITEGGLVPKDNPDNIQSARANRWGKYAIEELAAQGPERFQSIHRGFDTTYVNEDPRRLLPVDVMKELEGEGAFGRLYPQFLVTTGVATTMENARRIGREMSRDLVSAGVSGVILTST
jgi:glycine reductase complex component B subunit gamma